MSERDTLNGPMTIDTLLYQNENYRKKVRGMEARAREIETALRGVSMTLADVSSSLISIMIDVYSLGNGGGPGGTMGRDGGSKTS